MTPEEELEYLEWLLGDTLNDTERRIVEEQIEILKEQLERNRDD